MISEHVMRAFTGRMKLMKFFPTDPDVATALTDTVIDFCSTDEQLIWLGRRVSTLYAEWPGTRELRAVFCSRFKPADGINTYSEVYLEGIPAEPTPKPLELPPPNKKLELPAGHAVTVDDKFEEAIQEAAKLKGMPAAKPLKGRVSYELEQIITAPQDREPVPPPTPQIITQADIDAERERQTTPNNKPEQPQS